MNFSADIKGAAELEKVLRALPLELARRDLTASMMAGANIVRRAVQERAPVRSEPGAKRRSFGRTQPGFLALAIIRARVRRTLQSVTVAVGTGRAFWGNFKEFGTRYVAAAPWFRPAIDASMPAALNLIGLDLGKRLEKTTIRLAGPYLKSGLALRGGLFSRLGS